MAQRVFPHLVLLLHDACRSDRVSGLLSYALAQRLDQTTTLPALPGAPAQPALVVTRGETQKK